MIAVPGLEHPTGVTIVKFGVGAVFLAIVAICGMWSTLIYWEAMEKVNALLPESERFQPLFWGPMKRARLASEYRRLFPEGKDFKRIKLLFVVGLLALLCLAVWMSL
jgi:hypothetical protein